MRWMSEQNCSAVPPGSVLSLLVHPHWMQRDYISSCLLDVLARTSYLLEVLAPPLSASPDWHLIASPSCRWPVDSVHGLCFPLLWWSSAQDAPCPSLFPYFQPYQFRFHQSQLPSSSSTEACTRGRTSIQCPWHSPCASTLTLYFPMPCLAVCSYGWPIWWVTPGGLCPSLTNNTCLFCKAVS